MIAGVDRDAALLGQGWETAGPACEARRVGAVAGLADMALAAARSAPGATPSRLLPVPKFIVSASRARGGWQAAWCALAAVLGLLFSAGAARAQADTRPPQLLPVSSSSNDGRTLLLYFDEVLDGDSVPATSAFTVVVDGLNTTVTDVDLDVPRVTGTVALTLSPPRPRNNWYRVTYTPPGTNRLQDEAGNAVKAFSATYGSPESRPPPERPPRPTFFSPTLLTATAVSFSQIDLTWRDNSDNETGFRVQRRLGNSANWEEVGTTEADATTFSDVGLKPTTRYRYRVQAFNDADSSGFSSQAEATTPAAPEPTVTRFTPVRGPVGTAVTLTGTDFLGEVEVGFNGVRALEVEVLSTTSLEVIVPPEAASGPISVETVGGTAVSAELFTVTTGIGNRLFVPIVLSSRGRTPGSLFTSEMTLTNRGTTPAAIAYTYRAAFGGGSGTTMDELEPGRQRVIPDAIAYLAALGVPIGAGSAGGTLAVDFSNLSSPEVAAVTVRVATPVEEGRAGLAFPGLNPESLLAGSAFITGLRHNGQDRSNLALQNAGEESQGDITLRVTVYSGDGAASGMSEVLPDLTLPPGGFHQYNGILREAGIENGYVKVERVEGRAPYYAYGVINDQVNSDGSFVFPVREDSLVGRRGQTLPVLLETGDFSSELTVTNFSRVAKRVDFHFVAEGVESADGTAGFSLELEAGEQRILPQVVDWLRQQGVTGIGRANRAYVGALFAEVAEGDMSGIVMGARTGSPDQRGGQYSLFYSGVPYGLASVERTWIHGLQQNGENRSNLALVNTGEIDDSDSLFEIDIYTGGGEAGPRTRSVLLGPRGWYQLNGILGPAGQGYVQVRKVSGSNPFVAYGVINDGGKPGQRSGDGAFLLSRP